MSQLGLRYLQSFFRLFAIGYVQQSSDKLQVSGVVWEWPADTMDMSYRCVRKHDSCFEFIIFPVPNCGFNYPLNKGQVVRVKAVHRFLDRGRRTLRVEAQDTEGFMREDHFS